MPNTDVCKRAPGGQHSSTNTARKDRRWCYIVGSQCFQPVVAKQSPHIIAMEGLNILLERQKPSIDTVYCGGQGLLIGSSLVYCRDNILQGIRKGPSTSMSDRTKLSICGSSEECMKHMKRRTPYSRGTHRNRHSGRMHGQHE